MERKNQFVRLLVQSALIAAVYAVMTAVLTSFMSFGAVQFRIAEILVLLCFYNKKYCPALIVGCFIANLFSPFGWIDWVVGTSATALSVLLMTKVKNIWVAAMFPVIINGIFIGAEIAYLSAVEEGAELTDSMAALFFVNGGLVAFGQFVVIVVIGVPLFKFVFEKNKRIMELIRS